MPDFSVLHVGLSALRAAQLGMDTASHNISNAATPGFTRQRIDLATRPPRVTPEGRVGLGVDVAGISRFRDVFLDDRVRASTAAAARLSVRSDLLSRAELVMGEPDLGLSVELSDLRDVLETWALDPPDSASRTAVIDRLESFASRFNSVSAGVARLADDARAGVVATLAEASDVLARIGELNVAILDASSGAGPANDLLDRRDALVDRIAELTGAIAVTDPGGTVRVLQGGLTLVAGGEVSPLTVVPGGVEVVHTSGAVATPGGTAGGYAEVYGELLGPGGLVPTLGSFAEDLAASLNAAHAAALRPDSAPGGPLLTYSAGPPPRLTAAVAATGELAAAAGPPPAEPYDGSGIAGLLAVLDPAAVSLRGIVTGLGAEVSAASRRAATERGLAEAAGLGRDSVHGVSLDEELVALTGYQRIYEAAARVISAVDESLDVLINRTGVVGR